MGARFWVAGEETWLTLSRKVVVALGRLSLPLRWAAVKDLQGDGTLRVRDLNWAEVARVQALPKWRRPEGIPIRAQWRTLKGQDAPAGLEDKSPIGLKQAAFEAVCAGAGIEPYGAEDGEVRLAAWAVAALCGSAKEAQRFVRACGCAWDARGIHDAGQFTLPSGKWNVAGWRGFAMKYPEAVRFAHAWALVEEQLGGIPKSLTELREAACVTSYQGCETLEDVKVAQVAASFSMSEGHFLAYRDLVREGEKAWEAIPGVRLTGKDAGLEGDWEIRSLDAGDPLGPMLGLATNCCQHLHNAGAGCARHGWRSPYGAFVAVWYRGKVIAQSWLWRSRDTVVFDSIEALSGAYIEGIATLYVAAAKAMLRRLGVRAVRVGDTRYGITREIRDTLRGKECALSVRPEDYTGYMDGSSQWAIPGVPA